MNLRTILSTAGSVASLLSFTLAIYELKQKSRKAFIWAATIGVIIAGGAIFIYFWFAPSVQVLSVNVPDADKKIKVLSAAATIKIFSQAEHVKIILDGCVKGVDLSAGKHTPTAYMLVRPPTTNQIWYVQLSQRGTVSPEGNFTLHAYLGGTGPDRAQPGQTFGVVVLIADFAPMETYPDLQSIPLKHALSPVYQFEIVGSAREASQPEK